VAWFPSGEKKFFTSPKQLQSGSEAYPVCYSMVTMWGSLPGSKATEAWSWLLTVRHKFKNVQDLLPLQHTSIFLTFMGPCIVIIFYYINPNKMHMLEFILSDKCSTCFGRYYHPSSDISVLTDSWKTLHHFVGAEML
jgi:hypothetical protein